MHCPLCSGVDAMVHAIEAYTSKHKKNLVSDVLAREALALLSSNIRFVNNVVCGHYEPCGPGHDTGSFSKDFFSQGAVN